MPSPLPVDSRAVEPAVGAEKGVKEPYPEIKDDTVDGRFIIF